MADKSMAHLAGRMKPREARDIKSDAASRRFVEEASSQKDAAKGDAAKWQHAVQLAREDFGERADTDDREFLKRAEGYYATMDPESSSDEVRGKNGFTSAVENIAGAVDGFNDMLGDGVKAGWDMLAGTGAEMLGGLAGMFTGDEDTASDWREWTEGIVDDDTADALASLGTNLAVAAIPGVGVPASVALAGLQNADGINEALTGRDSVTLRQLGDDERSARAFDALLDIGLSAVPGLGKLDDGMAAARAAGKVAPLADDAGEAARIASKMNPVNQARALGNEAASMRRGFEAARDSLVSGAKTAPAPAAAKTGYVDPIDELAGLAKSGASHLKGRLGDAAEAYSKARGAAPAAGDAAEAAASGGRAAGSAAGNVASGGRAAKARDLGRKAVDAARRIGGSRFGQTIANPVFSLGVNAASAIPGAVASTGSGDPAAVADAVIQPNMQSVIRDILLSAAPGAKRAAGKLGMRPGASRAALSNRAFRDAVRESPSYDEVGTDELSDRMRRYYEED